MSRFPMRARCSGPVAALSTVVVVVIGLVSSAGPAFAVSPPARAGNPGIQAADRSVDVPGGVVSRPNGPSHPPWKVEHTPTPVADSGQLFAVACPRVKWCEAVGSYSGTSSNVTLAEAWNGVAWKSQPTPNPAAATSSTLYAVSCSSATACTAVGDYENGSGVVRALAERWNGRRWKIKSTPNPAGSTVVLLSGVSCISASDCIAVGNSVNGSDSYLTLAEIWNGATWKIQPTTNPGSYNVLYGVSCHSADNCTAVGQNDTGAYNTFVETWNGSTWNTVSSPNPSGAEESLLAGVSCSSAHECTAVGWFENSSFAELTLVEVWNGSTWKIQSSPNPGGDTDSDMQAVSCSSAHDCFAVGSSVNGSGSRIALVERWNGSKWKTSSSPKPKGELDGVSCASAAACTAVGWHQNGSRENRFGPATTLSETWNGSTWKIRPAPSSGQSELTGVSCSSADSCMAVGWSENSASTFVTLAQSWNGTSWTVQSTPNPSSDSALSGVSCSSATACTAVGSALDGSGNQTMLVERWNGTSWTIQPTPIPAGAEWSFLSAVSCSSATACTAVGVYENDLGHATTVAETWDGTSWTIQSSGLIGFELLGVSCLSATSCTAVGEDVTSSDLEVTLAEVWNGTSWTVQSTPNPTGAEGSTLYAVSCTSATACTAVGDYANSSAAQVSLAEVWNGARWTVQSTPTPSHPHDWVLTGVSCTSATAYTAVGAYANGSGTAVPLAEVWNGSSWSTESSTSPAGSQGTVLESVSCTSPGACTAVGWYTTSPGVVFTLAEAQ